MNIQNNKYVRLFLIISLAICGLIGALAANFHLKSNSETLVPGQVLGFYIPNVLGAPGEAAPMNVQPPNSYAPDSYGYPVPIRNDGTISLPCIHPVYVQGKTVREVRHLVNEKYRAGESPVLTEDVSICVCIYPDRESWDRFSFRDSLLERVSSLLGY